MQDQLEKYLDRKYILKSGRHIYYKGKHYFNAQLTDDIAAKAIKQNPRLANKFLTEREREVVERKVEMRNETRNLEDHVKDEPVEKRIRVLIDAGDLKDAKEMLKEIRVDATRDELEKEIKELQEKAKAEAGKKKQQDQDVLKQVDELLEKGDVEGAEKIAEGLKGNLKGQVTKKINAKKTG